MIAVGRMYYPKDEEWPGREDVASGEVVLFHHICIVEDQAVQLLFYVLVSPMGQPNITDIHEFILSEFILRFHYI